MDDRDGRCDRDPGGKIFAIGDIHGCGRKLKSLLRRIPFDKDRDTLIFLGDYINRGHDSRHVLETLVQVGQDCANVVFLKGNHDQTLLQYIETGDIETFRLLRIMGGDATAASYDSSILGLREPGRFPRSHLDFLHSLRFAFVSGKYVFTHADLSEDLVYLLRSQDEMPAIPAEAEMEMLSSRRLGHEMSVFEQYTIVFGHIPFATPLVRADRIGIDTGAAYGGYLTAVELPARRFHHA